MTKLAALALQNRRQVHTQNEHLAFVELSAGGNQSLLSAWPNYVNLPGALPCPVRVALKVSAT